MASEASSELGAPGCGLGAFVFSSSTDTIGPQIENMERTSSYKLVGTENLKSRRCGKFGNTRKLLTEPIVNALETCDSTNHNEPKSQTKLDNALETKCPDSLKSTRLSCECAIPILPTQFHQRNLTQSEKECADLTGTRPQIQYNDDSLVFITFLIVFSEIHVFEEWRVV